MNWVPLTLKIEVTDEEIEISEGMAFRDAIQLLTEQWFQDAKGHRRLDPVGLVERRVAKPPAIIWKRDETARRYTAIADGEYVEIRRQVGVYE
jgi:hypothetical protein